MKRSWRAKWRGAYCTIISCHVDVELMGGIRVGGGVALRLKDCACWITVSSSKDHSIVSIRTLHGFDNILVGLAINKRVMTVQITMTQEREKLLYF